MNNNNERPSWRKPVGMFAIISLIFIWVFAIVSLSGYIGQIHILAQAFVYLVAGIIWIAPLRAVDDLDGNRIVQGTTQGLISI